MRGTLAFLALAGLAATAGAQDPGSTVPSADKKHGGSPNIRMIAHVDNHPGAWKAADIEMEQDPGRPYMYVCGFVNYDVQIYDVRAEAHPRRVAGMGLVPDIVDLDVVVDE